MLLKRLGMLALGALALGAVALPLQPAKAQLYFGTDLGGVGIGIGVPGPYYHPYYAPYAYPRPASPYYPY